MAIQLPSEAKSLALKIAEQEKADLYLYSGPVNEDGYGALVHNLNVKSDAVLLILNTYGGSANSAYRIGRLFQSIYGSFGLLTFSYCKSAGTLIATGASRILMGEAAELGPLDVQLRKRDELWEQRSGLLLRSALTNLADSSDELFTKIMVSIKSNSRGDVRFRLASRIASRMTRGLMAPIYSQITPEGLGEDYQDLMVAFEYAKRLASVGGLISHRSIRKLVHEYPSHDFVIDKLEAKDLFGEVEDPSQDMYALGTALSSLAYSPDNKEVTAVALHVLSKENQESAEKTPQQGNENGKSTTDEAPKDEGSAQAGSTSAA